MYHLIIACIPAYNEALTIGEVVKETLEYVDKVIVCDDGSLDDTEVVARMAGADVIRNIVNLGKGGALKVTFRKALDYEPRYVIVLDGDQQHDPRDIPVFIEALDTGEYDAVIGSRYMSESQTNAPIYRRVGLSILQFVNSASNHNNIVDTQSGFRAFNKDAIELLMDGRELGYNVEMEQIKLLIEKGARIGEVPIKVDYDVPNPSKKNPLEHGLELIVYMVNMMIVQRPLLYLAVPGMVLTLIGGAFLVLFLSTFNETGYFSIPISLLSIGFLLFGMLILMNSFVLQSINQTRKTS